MYKFSKEIQQICEIFAISNIDLTEICKNQLISILKQVQCKNYNKQKNEYDNYF